MRDMATTVARQKQTKRQPGFWRIRLDQQTPSSLASSKAPHFPKPFETASERMCDGCERLSGVAARVGLSKATTCQASPVQRWHSCKRNGIHRGGTRAGVASVLFVRLKTIRPGNLLCLPHPRRPAQDRMGARREAVSVNPRNLAYSHSTMRTASALGFGKPVRSNQLHMCGIRPMLSPRPHSFTRNRHWASRDASALPHRT